MNIYAFQVNNLSDELRKKLPPTDSRLRPDIRFWEHADLEKTSSEKSRLETNQRKRRQILKDRFKKEKAQGVDIKDERTFYQPAYFKKEIVENKESGKKEYIFSPNGNKYWEERDKGTWDKSPNIFEDDCKPFY